MRTGEFTGAMGKRAPGRMALGGTAFWTQLLVLTVFLAGFQGGCSGLVSGAKQAIQAAFQLNPTSINFGRVTVGKQSTQTVAISNTGSSALSITQATFSNPQFTLPGASFPMSLGTGQSGNLTVAVTPTAAGAVNGTLTVQGSDGSSPATVNLSATAAVTGPQISLSQSAVQFGTVSVGSTGSSTVSISNTGSSDLTISVISVTGSEFGEMGISTPRTISAGQSASMQLTYKPTAAGSDTGSLTITSNDPANPTETITMSGAGSSTPSGQLQANPTSLSFGNVSTGANSTLHVTLTNSGNAAVQITSIVAGGPGFTVNGFSVPLTLNPSASATVNVVFAPTSAGSVTGTLTVTSNANGSPLTISLNATGTQAGLSISPSSFAFGSVVDGQTKSQTFTLTNTGSSTLTVSQLAVSGAGYSINGLTVPATLAGGTSKTFNAVFAPTTAGNLSGTVTVASNAPNSPATIALSGTGVASTVTLTANPTSLSFGSVNSGSSSTKSVTLTNNGNANLTISQITVNAKDTTQSGVSLPVTLTPGQTQAMNVKFSPTAAETVSGNITVTNSQGSSAVISISGTGLQAGISLTPSTANLGSVVVGSTNSQTIQLSNTGNATLTITQASVTGTGFSTSGLSLPLSINAGQSSTFNAQFRPSGTGTASGTISIVSNAPGSPTTVALAGTGVAATQTLSFTTTNVNFGNVNTGTSATQNEAITNTGNSSVQISQISASGTGYSLSGANVPVTLSPSQKMTFSVIFNPTAAGSSSGSVTVTSNAAGSPVTIALSGTGVQATQHTVSLSWTASTSTVSGYNIYRSATSGSAYIKLNGTLVPGVNYTDSTVQSGVTYYYVTTAVDSTGDESSYSNEASAVIP